MGWIQTSSSQLLRRFAEQRRRVIADWRILIELRRIAQSDESPLPSWQEAEKVLVALLRTKELVQIKGAKGVYRAESPYAAVLPVPEEQVVQESNPSAVFSFLTALAHHGLTDQISPALYATSCASLESPRIPLGTTPEDWSELPYPIPRYPKTVGPVPVNWVHLKSEWDFGSTPSYGHGLPVYMTDIERTLLDSLRAPNNSGGITNVLRAWYLARDRIDLSKLVRYTELFGQLVLRQRVGFVVEKLGLSHPSLAVWKAALLRGGSLKLLASAPYASEFSAEWNLSLNVPSSVLAELEGA